MVSITQMCFLLLTLLVEFGMSLPGYAALDYHSYPKYSFKYGVSDAHTGDIKQQTEHREGDVVKGQYSLVEPDGSVRTVDYTADPVNGFNAVVVKSPPSIHATVVKPVAAVAPQPVIISKPVQQAVVPVPVNYVAKAPVHYAAEPIINHIPLAYTQGYDPYGGQYLQAGYDYGHY